MNVVRKISYLNPLFCEPIGYDQTTLSPNPILSFSPVKLYPVTNAMLEANRIRLKYFPLKFSPPICPRTVFHLHSHCITCAPFYQWQLTNQVIITSTFSMLLMGMNFFKHIKHVHYVLHSFS